MLVGASAGPLAEQSAGSEGVECRDCRDLDRPTATPFPRLGPQLFISPLRVR